MEYKSGCDDNICLYVYFSFLVPVCTLCVCFCVCNIKSECQTCSKLDFLLHKTYTSKYFWEEGMKHIVPRSRKNVFFMFFKTFNRVPIKYRDFLVFQKNHFLFNPEIFNFLYFFPFPDSKGQMKVK